MQKKADFGILIADDDEAVLLALETILEAETEFQVKTTASGKGAMHILLEEKPDIALLDLTLADMNGIEILQQAKEKGVQAEIVLITGHGSIDTAVEAMRLGAYDYLTKPLQSKEIIRVLHRAAEKCRLVQKNRQLQEQVDHLTRYEDLIGKSAKMRELFCTLDAVAGSDAAVLVGGESGTGKELAAHAIHRKSTRSKGSFVAVNCAALPANILESELFGHVRGAFTGAVKDKMGYFEQASGGTIFLDEITEMPIELQAKLLRALETHTFRQLGGSKDMHVDVRVIAASNRDSQEAIREKNLREDLFYRLAVIEIDMPALRERPDDIPLLAHAFLKIFARTNQKKITGFANETLQLLMNYDWPGNVRELKNAIERAVILCASDSIRPKDLPPRIFTAESSVKVQLAEDADCVIVPIGTTVAEMEKLLIKRTLAHTKNNKTRAAGILGLSLKTLHNKLGRYSENGRKSEGDK